MSTRHPRLSNPIDNQFLPPQFPKPVPSLTTKTIFPPPHSLDPSHPPRGHTSPRRSSPPTKPSHRKRSSRSLARSINNAIAKSALPAITAICGSRAEIGISAGRCASEADGSRAARAVRYIIYTPPSNYRLALSLSAPRHHSRCGAARGSRASPEVEVGHAPILPRAYREESEGERELGPPPRAVFLSHGGRARLREIGEQARSIMRRTTDFQSASRARGGGERGGAPLESKHFALERCLPF